MTTAEPRMVLEAELVLPCRVQHLAVSRGGYVVVDYDLHVRWIDTNLRLVADVAFPPTFMAAFGDGAPAPWMLPRQIHCALACDPILVAVRRWDALELWRVDESGVRQLAACDGRISSGFAFGADGRELWVIDDCRPGSGWMLKVLDCDSLALLASGLGPASPESPHFDFARGTGQMIVSACVVDPQEDWSTWLVERDGRDVRIVRELPLEGTEAALSWDDRRMMSRLERDGVALCVRDPSTLEVRAQVGGSLVAPRSPDGRWWSDVLGYEVPIEVGPYLVTVTERGFFAIIHLEGNGAPRVFRIAPGGATANAAADARGADGTFFNAVRRLKRGHDGRLVSWAVRGVRDSETTLRLWSLRGSRA